MKEVPGLFTGPVPRGENAEVNHVSSKADYKMFFIAILAYFKSAVKRKAPRFISEIKWQGRKRERGAIHFPLQLNLTLISETKMANLEENESRLSLKITT